MFVGLFEETGNGIQREFGLIRKHRQSISRVFIGLFIDIGDIFRRAHSKKLAEYLNGPTSAFPIL